MKKPSREVKIVPWKLFHICVWSRYYLLLGSTWTVRRSHGDCLVLCSVGTLKLVHLLIFVRGLLFQLSLIFLSFRSGHQSANGMTSVILHGAAGIIPTGPIYYIYGRALSTKNALFFWLRDCRQYAFVARFFLPNGTGGRPSFLFMHPLTNNSTTV